MARALGTLLLEQAVADRKVVALAISDVSANNKATLGVGRLLERHRAARLQPNRPEANHRAVGQRVRLLRPDGLAASG